MNNLSTLLNNNIMYAAGWTIIHSLWQCTLIALIIVFSYAFTKKARAATRYWINAGGLLGCVMASGITFAINLHSPVGVEIISDTTTLTTNSINQFAHAQTLSDIINRYLHQIVLCWMMGVGLYIVKYLADFFYCQHIKHHNNTHPNDVIQQIFNELKNSLGIKPSIQLRISEAVDIPCVIGHFAPVVLLPASLILGLSTQQIKVILLHELGHISRRDYLISSVQTIITSLYFFNPFARWISSKMDEERENACDDIAVTVSGDPLFYANTLKEFAEMNNNYSPTINLTGRKNLLISRIKRLFISDNSFSKTYGKAITVMMLFLSGIGYSVSSISNENKTETAFSFRFDNMQFIDALRLAKQSCPDNLNNINLHYPERKISMATLSATCENIKSIFLDMDKNMAEGKMFKIDINKEKLSAVFAKFTEQCPHLASEKTLKNPDSLVSFSSEMFSCHSFQETIEEIDSSKQIEQNPGSLTATLTRVTKQCPEFEGTIVVKNPEQLIALTSEAFSCESIKSTIEHIVDYASKAKVEAIFENKARQEAIFSKVIMTNVNFPSELKNSNMKGYCDSVFSVDENGRAFNIIPKCESDNPEAAVMFNKIITDAIVKSQFQPALVDGKPIIVNDVHTRQSFRMASYKPQVPSNATEKFEYKLSTQSSTLVE